jgi:hypothetical protein
MVVNNQVKKHRGKALKPTLQLMSLRLDREIIDFLNQHSEKNLQVTIRKILRGYIEAHLDDYERYAPDESFEDEKLNTISSSQIESISLQDEKSSREENPLESSVQDDFKVSIDCHEIYTHIREMMKRSHMGSDGYGGQKKAAKLALESFGEEWVSKNPASVDAIVIRLNLRDIIKETTPKTHSNYYVVWQRFQKYALE